MSLFEDRPSGYFADVILPLALPKLYTYVVPRDLLPEMEVGKRVEIQFGKSKLYSALVYRVHEEPPTYSSKPILNILDPRPVANPTQLKFWTWLAEYYCCTMGEVMQAALPSGLKLSSETRVIMNPLFDEDYEKLSDKEYLITEALSIQNELSIQEIQQILDQKTVYPIIQRLLHKRVLYLREELKEKFTPKTVSAVKLADEYLRPDGLKAAFDRIGTRAIKQVQALMAYAQLAKETTHIKKKALLEAADISDNILRELVKKGVMDIYDLEISRIASYEDELIMTAQLTAAQIKAKIEIQQRFQEKKVCLLHGVTGSGKTQIYIDLIREYIEKEQQILYLLPEIALTTQIIRRLQKVFGDDIVVYHSRLNANERVELWDKVARGQKVVLGPRSSLFLPYSNLGLVIVDEEHDPSYKQQDPAPRYNGRDCAIYLAHMHGAKTLLGTATPSVETYYNAERGKYGLVTLDSRFGDLAMPDIEVLDLGKSRQKKQLKGAFSGTLLEQLKQLVENKEQAILFQNRRGYAPNMNCETCGWTSMCVHCDVALTYHQYQNRLRCHYCGYQTKIPDACPACGSHTLVKKGFGTERLEEELKIHLPEARIARMDWDTVKGKHAHGKLISSFENHELDILIGTQMVTKGLDFDNVGLVGVISADKLLHFPDFRASERAFQLLTQVSGRAGRKFKQGRVMIQAYQTGHPVIHEVVAHDYHRFFNRELQERKQFHYPPFNRLIRLTLKHKKKDVVYYGAEELAQMLKARLGARVLGPSEPGINRVRGLYLMNFLIKLERDPKFLPKAKRFIQTQVVGLQGKKGYSSLRINIDVDPY
ncbi:MAG: primosomal protein N' [Bacteroidota bacterium]